MKVLQQSHPAENERLPAIDAAMDRVGALQRGPRHACV